MTTLVYGKNSYMIKSYLEDLINTFQTQGGSRDEVHSVWVEDDTDINELLMSMQNVSIFSAKKLTILYDFTKQPRLVEAIKQFCLSADELNWLIFVDTTLQARSKIVTYLQKEFGATILKADQKKEQELIQWICAYVKELSGVASITPANAAHLVHRVGDDQQLIATEIKKLVSGLDHGAEIKKYYIDNLVEMTPQSSVFAMLDAILASQPKKAMEIYHEQLAQGSAPQQILGMIVWQLTQLAIVVDAQHKTNKELTDNYGVSSFAVSKLRPIASLLTNSDMSRIVVEVMEADYQSRTNATVDDAIEYIVSYISVYLNNKKQRPS